MSRRGEEGELLARRYAAAFFDLALEKQSVEKQEAFLKDLVGLWEADKELREILIMPSLSEEERSAVLRKLIEKGGADELGGNLLYLLLAKGRIDILPELLRAFSSMKEKHEKVVTLKITSARPLDEGIVNDLKKKLSESSGWTIRVDTEIDKKLMGGAVLNVGDRVLDGSIRGRINRMRTALRMEKE